MNQKLPVSQITLERYVLNELSSEEQARVEALLKAETGTKPIAQAIAEIRRSNELIAQEYPAEVMLPSILKKNKGNVTQLKPRLQSASRSMIWIGLTAAASLVVVLVPSLMMNRPGEGFRTKGLSPTISLYRQSRNESPSEKLASNARLRAGDRVQLAYIAGDAKFGAIFSIDGRGQITWHFPETAPAQAIPLAAVGENLLPHSFELDNSPQFEKFVFVYGESAFSIPEMVSAIRPQLDKSEIALPSGVQAQVFVVQKLKE